MSTAEKRGVDTSVSTVCQRWNSHPVEAPPYFYGNLRMAFAHPMKTELKFTLIPRLLHVSTHSSFYRPACIKDHLLAAGLTMGQNPGQIMSRRNLDEPLITKTVLVRLGVV